MSESMGFDAEVGLDVAKAIKAARDLAGTLADLNQSVGGTSKELDKAEKASAGIAGALQKFAKSSDVAASSASQQASAIRKLVGEYNSLNKAATAARERGKNAASAVLPDGSTVSEAAKQQNAIIKSFEDARLTQAQATNKQLIADDKKVRASELAELRAAIQKRAEVENTARAETKKIHDQQAKDAMAAYRRQLAEAEKTAKEISRVWEQAAQANRQFDVNKMGQQVNAQSLRQNLGTDLMASMRGTAEYTNLIDRSVQGLANQRYALYDVATTFGVIATATAGAGIAAVAMGASYEKAFAQVERTTLATGTELQQLHSDLVDISTTLPTSFQDVSSIATLGAQLNIANENLAGFTQTVSQFAATTDVTVERAAMGFGRLAQLTKTPQQEISNLGSAIYQTGINSVATEGEILSVAEQIATAGNLAGFTNTQVVALASALSSLGVAPEQARGAIMRIFGDITAAVGEGGDALQGFADMAGLSAQEFAAMWQDSPQEAFNAYIAGAEKVIQVQGDLDSALKNQGFINIRDRNVITRLANNTEVYNSALADTAQAYDANTALAEGAAIANDNLADKLTVLMNTIKALMAEAGQNEALNGLVDLLTRLLGTVLDFVQTPIGKVVATVVLGFGALVGAVAASVAALAMGKASLLALITAMHNNDAASNRNTLSLRALTVELLRMGSAGPRAAAGLTAVTAAANASGGALARGRAGAAAYTASMGAATTATRGFATVAKGALISTGIGAAFIALVGAIDLVSKAFASAEDKAKAYFEAASGTGLSGLAQAITEDTAAAKEGGAVYREYTEWVGGAGARNASTADQIRNASGAQWENRDAVEATNQALENQIRILGDKSKAVIADSLATDENFQKLWEQKDVLDALGFSIEEFIDRTLAAPGGGNAYIKELIDDYNTLYQTGKSGFEATGISLDDMAIALSNLRTVSDAYQAEIDSTISQEQIRTQVLTALGVELDETADSTLDAAGANEEYGDTLNDMVDAMFAATSATASVQDAVQALGESLGENGNSFSAFTEGGRENLKALQSTISAMATQAGDDSVLLATNVAGLMAELQSYGVDVGNELGFVGDTLNQLVGNQWGIDFNSAPARADIQAFINSAIAAIQMRANLERAAATARTAAYNASGNSVAAALSAATGAASNTIYQSQINGLKQFQGQIASATTSAGTLGKTLRDGFGKGREAANKAGKAAKDAGKGAGDSAKEFRTLVDYASDLESVWKRAFDIRFGPQQAADQTASALAKMRESIESNNQALADARLRVQELNAELASLRADNTTLGYQLQVAIEYGDELRANEIRAKMAENNAELAQTESDKTKAQKEANKAQNALTLSLSGNSDAAIANRADVLSLVQSYQSQIQALASSGMSTDQLARKTEELRQDFIRQLTQMGYNRAEVNQYARAFDDMAKVLATVPRNITVTANANPAQQAINEFIARNNNRTVNMRVAAGGVGDIGAGVIRPSGVAVGNGGITTPSLSATTVKTASGVTVVGPVRVSTGGLIPEYHAAGGIGGMHPGSPKGTDTVPAWLTPGEYVQKKQAVDYYGLPFMNAINSLQFPRYFAQGSGGGAVVKGSPGSSVQLVELLPNQLNQLAQLVSTQVNLDGEKITTNVNEHNVQTTVRGGA